MVRSRAPILFLPRSLSWGVPGSPAALDTMAKGINMHRPHPLLQSALFSALLALAVSCGGGGGASVNGSDGTGNTLFVSDVNHGVIGAFPVLDPRPGSSVTGKTISVPLLGQNLAYVAATDELYATSGSNIIVLPRASTASGAVAPSRTITISPHGREPIPALPVPGQGQRYPFRRGRTHL